MNLEQLNFLTQNETIKLILELSQKQLDLLKLATKLDKGFTLEQRQAVLTALELLPLTSKKFQTNHLLICDRLAYEQATASDLSKWKVKKFIPQDISVDDLCCGMGGDSFFLENRIVTGVDFSPERIKMFEHNTKIMGIDAKTSLSDVRTYPSNAKFYLLDPARRSNKNQSQWDINNLTPNLKEIEDISLKYSMGLVKLGPGMDTDQFNFNHSRCYLGNHKGCRELLLLTGDLAQDNLVKAYNFNTNFHLEYPINSMSDLKLEVKAIGEYILEPEPCFIRSHLFPLLQNHHPLWAIDPHIAYLSTDKKPPENLPLKCYQIIDSTTSKRKKVKAMLTKHNIGNLTIKKRGVDMDPAIEIKKLKPKGDNSGILIYARISSGVEVYLCQDC